MKKNTKENKDQRKRRRIFRAKSIPPDIAKVEFKDVINNCLAPFLIIGKVRDSYTDSEGYMKIWVEMSPALTAGPKVIRSEVKGHITTIYQERIARQMLLMMSRGVFYYTIPEYLEHVAAENLKNHTRIIIKRK